MSAIGNFLWFILGGHVLAGIALAPIGKTIVSKEVAAAVRRENAEEVVAQHRNGTS